MQGEVSQLSRVQHIDRAGGHYAAMVVGLASTITHYFVHHAAGIPPIASARFRGTSVTGLRTVHANIRPFIGYKPHGSRQSRNRRAQNVPAL